MSSTQAVIRPAAGRPATAQPSRLGLALAVIATAQLMVVLDATIVNVTLPHIQRSLGFSGSGLEWVVNAYTLAFGGLLLLGGRAGDLLGRRRVFICGVLLFSLASLAGGLATSQAWLLGARAIQGVGAAITAPTALSLVATTFPEGAPRNRAMGVYAAMSVAGATTGLIAGGVLTTYLSWRWVFFVNAPIGVALALAAPRVLSESPRRPGRFDLPGAITATSGLVALVYGLSSAATGPDGASQWTHPKVVVTLALAAVLLTTFVIIERRSTHALLPLRLLRDRNRSGAYLIMLCVGTALFGMFFFLTIFMQAVWGFSALKTGLAYLPFTGGVLLASGTAAQLVPRVGARPLLLAGSAITASGMFWLSQISEHSHYAGALLGPMFVTAVGFGLLFVPLSLVALSHVREQDTGVAASLLNTGQQVGGSIGLALLGTVAWTVVGNTVASYTRTGSTHAHVGQLSQSRGPVAATIYRHALATGFSRGFLVAAGIAVLAFLITVCAIRIRRADLAGDPIPETVSS